MQLILKDNLKIDGFSIANSREKATLKKEGAEMQYGNKPQHNYPHTGGTS